MLIIPIRLIELIFFCGPGVLTLDVFVSSMSVTFPMLTETGGGGGGGYLSIQKKLQHKTKPS